MCKAQVHFRSCNGLAAASQLQELPANGEAVMNQPEATYSDYKLLMLIKDLCARVNELESKPEAVTPSASEPVKEKGCGTIQWVADECVGYLCMCGESLVVGIYEDNPAVCQWCKSAYVLKQTNVVMQVQANGA